MDFLKEMAELKPYSLCLLSPDERAKDSTRRKIDFTHSHIYLFVRIVAVTMTMGKEI